MPVRFRSRNATPAGGCYEYSADGKTFVTDKSIFGISKKAVELRVALGLEIHGDPFTYVMEYMCPHLPNGFCTSPSAVKNVQADEVKAATARLFQMPCVTSEIIERRMAACVSCPRQLTRGFCMGCSGLLDWVYRSFNGRRPRLPPDLATGVCSESLELVAASASVDRPAVPGDRFPETCWRRAAEEKVS